jgi:hypothetical protein
VLPNKLPLPVPLPKRPPAVVAPPKSEELVVPEVDGALEDGF